MKKYERESTEKLLKEISPYYNRNAETVKNMTDSELERTYERELCCAKAWAGRNA